MTARLRWRFMAVIAVGLALALYTIGRVGFVTLVAAATRIGVGGFVLMCLYTLATLGVLGAAWLAAIPGEPAARLPLFAWARAAREAASDLLPFSQLGGLVVGGRIVAAAGVPLPKVYAGVIVDLTTEMAGQFVLTLFGLAVLLVFVFDRGQAVTSAAWAGTGVCVATLAAFVALQRPLLALAARLGARLLPDARLPFEAIGTELAALYRARRPVLLSFLWNIVAWLMTGLLAWMVLRAMGVTTTPARAIALESLILAVRSAAFLIPGGLGVQEAGYLLLAHAFGIDPQAAVAYSLVKRARDVAIGVPTLLVWQAVEWRSGSRRTT